MSERRQMIIVGVLVGLLVLLFVLGVGGGALRDDPKDSVNRWRNRLDSLDTAALLTPEQLSTSDCLLDVATSTVQVTGQCGLSVPAAERFSLRSVRQLVLAPRVGTIRFDTQVEGQQISDSVTAGSSATLSFGRGSADVVLTCLELLPCLIDLPM